jgi:hypothetical protein
MTTFRQNQCPTPAQHPQCGDVWISALDPSVWHIFSRGGSWENVIAGGTHPDLVTPPEEEMIDEQQPNERQADPIDPAPVLAEGSDTPAQGAGDDWEATPTEHAQPGPQDPSVSPDPGLTEPEGVHLDPALRSPDTQATRGVDSAGSPVL